MSETNNTNKNNIGGTENVATDGGDLKENLENDSTIDDVDIEDVDIDETDGNAKDIVRKLKEKLKQVESEKQEYLNGWQRTRAEYVNSRKNDVEDRQSFLRFAEAGLITDLLSILDSFETAFNNKKQEWESLPEEWRTGIKNIYNQFVSVLNNRGLKTIEALGENFDPQKHEAIGIVPTDKTEEDHKVINVVQKGYLLNDKLIRTARVQVGEYSSKSVE